MSPETATQIQCEPPSEAPPVALELLESEEQPTSSSIWDRLGPTALDQHVGFRMAKMLDLQSFGLFGRIMQHVSALEEAASVAERYSALVCTDLRLQVSTEAGSVRIQAAGPCNALLLPPQAEFFVTLVRRMVHDLAPGLSLAEVSVPFAPPENSRMLDDYLGCAVTYRCQKTEVVLDRDVASRPLPRGNPHLIALLLRDAENDLAKVWPSRDFLLNAERVYQGAFERKDVQLSTLARDMRMSSRTLQRRLQAHGTSHRDMLDRVRRQRALSMLATTRFPLRVVAIDTGFAEPGAFCRAFRRWTSMSPGMYRNVYCGRSRWQALRR